MANINPTEPDDFFDAQYWVVNRFGTGMFNTDLTFTISEDLTASDEANPSQIKLYTRSSTADDDWIYLTNASSVNAANDEVTFAGITEFSQFIIGRWIQSLDIPQNVIIEIIGTEVQLSWDEVVGANSYKIYASNDPEGAFEDVSSSGSFENATLRINRDITRRKKSINRKNIRNYRTNQTWIAEINGINKKFFYVVASTDVAVRESITKQRLDNEKRKKNSRKRTRK